MKTVNDIDVFTLSRIQDRPATMYHHEKENSTYVYIGADRYNIPDGQMALARHGDDIPLGEKFLGFRFREDVRLEGQICVFQIEENYMVMFATSRFTDQEDAEAINDIILLKVGNALKDVENYK